VYRKLILLLLLAVLAALAAAGCKSLKDSKPIMPIEEYEKLLVGRLDANYIGTGNCLSACHEHDNIRRDFEASTMGAQMSSSSGMPIVDCETCHGPGSLAVEGLTPEKVAKNAAKGIKTKCRNETFIDIKNLPPTAKSLMCLKCHTANATFNLHEWNAGTHAIEDVTCINCHNIHQGPDLITSPRDIKDMCFECHGDTRAEFSLRSHHPVMEDKVFCNNCHNPHGVVGEKLTRGGTIRETCTKCHAEFRGPYTYEHADLTEDCLECHRNHGSPNSSLLVADEPFLCMQCHSGHRTSAGTSVEAKVTFYTRCTDCHSRIHGTDLPSPSTGRGFTR